VKFHSKGMRPAFSRGRRLGQLFAQPKLGGAKVWAPRQQAGRQDRWD
jgi:hypothetical protein